MSRSRDELEGENEELRGRIAALEAEVCKLGFEPARATPDERRRAEARLTHLNSVLKAVRNVNQLIVKEKDRDRLVQRVCECLVETRGHGGAWIALLGDSPTLVSAGLGEHGAELRRRLDHGPLPECARLALAAPGVQCVREPVAECQDCPLALAYQDRGGMAVRLEAGGRVFGLLGVSVPRAFVDDAEEQALLREVADDVAFALDAIDREVQRGRAEERHRLLFNSGTDAILVHAADRGRYLEVNDVACDRLGYSREQLLQLSPTDIFGPDLASIPEDTWRQLREGGRARFELNYTSRDGSHVPVEVCAHRFVFDGQPAVLSIARDISERRRAEEALREAEVQLRQAQKLEAVGRLAGGLAHDFNNLMTVILMNCHFLATEAPGPGGAEVLAEIRGAAQRAAELARQLLAFSRKQVLQPRVLDLDAVIQGVDKMLRRLIGEDIDVVAAPQHGLWPVFADPGQIEQVIMNLAVNARDAMPGGGKLTVETANVELDEEFARRHVGVVPGPHVLLAVSDSGCGMDEETLSHVFEPFFTTKPAGQGTGLGLSTVYGIVKQSGGSVWVHSEPGLGTSVKVYLPRAEGAEARDEAAPDAPAAVAAGGTVLVVEDDPHMRKALVRQLERCGYSVLAAADGLQGLALAGDRQQRIDLLLTDVVMPNMSGRQLAERLAVSRPGIKVLYMSGYTGNAIAHHGVLDPGTAFLQKPFAPDLLAATVRRVLEGQPPPNQEGEGSR